MSESPRNLRTMLAEAKDHSELMIDLAYAALFFNDEGMAEEVDDLEKDLLDRVHVMREICILGARSVKEAEQMSSVLLVVSAIERMANAAVDISRIVTHNLGVPPALLNDLAHAQEVSHRVRVREDSEIARHSLEELELPTVSSMYVVAIRRAKDWIIDPGGEEVIVPDDVLIVRGSPEGIHSLREKAGAPAWKYVEEGEDIALTDLDRAVDVIVEMKDISEVAIGLAYSSILFSDRSLASEVMHLENRIDEMQEHLEIWILREASQMVDPSSLRGLLRLGRAAEEIGDAAQQLVWLVEEDEEMHPILQLSLGESDEVVVRMPVADSSEVAGKTIRALNLEIETGFYLLAIRRASRYIYRPRSTTQLLPGDELIATGPNEGREHLAELCGYQYHEDEETGEWELILPSESEESED